MSQEKSRLFCLGGEGFVGRNILEGLSDFYNCTSIADTPSLFPRGKYKYLKIDPYNERIVQVQDDLLVHLIDNGRCEKDEFESRERKLWENISGRGLKHLILFSSAVVYTDPQSSYGQRKVMLERIYADICQQNGVKLTILRLFNVFGLYQLPHRQGSFVANVIWNHIQGKETEVKDKDARRDFLFAADIASHIHHIIQNEIVGTFDLASNYSRTIGEIIELLEKEVFHEEIRFLDRHEHEEKISPQANNPFIPSLPMTPISQALRQTARFYRENFSIIKRAIARNV